MRRAVQQDAGAIADVWLRSRHASVPAIPPPVHTDEEVRGWFASVVLPTRETWVVEDGGAIVAMMVLEDEGDAAGQRCGWVDQLYVDPRFTGRGLGSRLLELAKERYPDGLDLWAFQSNTAARQFYERHGFAAVEMTDGDNEEGAPDVRYHWATG